MQTHMLYMKINITYVGEILFGSQLTSSIKVKEELLKDRHGDHHPFLHLSQIANFT